VGSRQLTRVEQIVGPEPREATFAPSVIRLSYSVAPWPGQLRRSVALMTVHEDIFATVVAFQTTNATTDQEIVDELVARGYGRLRAELLAVFVPLGLARAVIARVSSKVRLPETAVVLDGDQRLTVPLAFVPEFETARHVGEETFSNGVIPRELFSSIVSFSVELKLINRMLDAGKELAGATFAPPHLTRLAKAPGFERWYQTVTARSS
jgi:hypothetical protein